MHEQHRPRVSRQRASRRWASAAALTILLIILAACGTATTAEPTAAPAAPGAEPTAAPASGAEPTTISWMVFNDDVANDKNLQAEIKLYNDSQSEVNVELIGVGWNDFSPKLQAMVAAGTPPDVISIQREAEFVSKGFLLPLEELIARDNLDLGRFLPGAHEPAYDGKYYGFRHDTAYWMLYYNKELFDKAGVAYPPAAGWTLDEFMSTACKLSNPAEMQWGMHNLNWLTSILIQQQGLPYIAVADGVPQYKLDDPQTLAFYQKISDFINKDNCQPNADQNSSLGGSDPFVAGRAAMKFDGNWGFGGMKENAKFKWAVAPLPGLKQPNVGMKIGIVKTSKNQDAAWKFLKWLTYEPEATRFRSEHGMAQPAINDEQALKSFLSGPSAPEGLEAVFKVLGDPANSFALPSYPGSAEADNIINPATDEVINGLTPAADAIPAAVQQANPTFAEEYQKATGAK